MSKAGASDAIVRFWPEGCTIHGQAAAASVRRAADQRRGRGERTGDPPRVLAAGGSRREGS